MGTSEIQVYRRRGIKDKALRMSKSLLSGFGGKGLRGISGIISNMSKDLDIGVSIVVLINLQGVQQGQSQGPHERSYVLTSGI